MILFHTELGVLEVPSVVEEEVTKVVTLTGEEKYRIKLTMRVTDDVVNALHDKYLEGTPVSVTIEGMSTISCRIYEYSVNPIMYNETSLKITLFQTQ